MVEHEALSRMPIDEPDRLRQLRRVDEDVVGQVEAFERAEAFVERLAVQEPCRLGLDDVADADERGVLGQRTKHVLHVAGLQIDPPDDSRDEVRGTHGFEQCVVLRRRLPGLHGDGRAHVRAARGLRQVVDTVVALQDAHVRTYPRILGRAVAPEVMVTVDGHVSQQALA